MKSNQIYSLLRRSDAVATYGILTAGVVHTVLTPVFKPKWFIRQVDVQ